MKKILLITGASSEVGVHLLDRVSDKCDRIYLQFRTMNTMLEEAIKFNTNRSELIPLQADLTEESSVQNMIQKIKDTMLLPNQFVHLPAPKAYNLQFHKDTWDRYEQGWEISVRSIVLMLEAFIKNMAKENYGRIVFMLTSDTLNNPVKYQSSYVTVKYALLGLMKALSVEYADRGITANGVSPDMMETKFLSDLPELLVAQNRKNSPINRNIMIEEVIPIIEYMLSDAGAAMTGQNIGITGAIKR